MYIYHENICYNEVALCRSYFCNKLFFLLISLYIFQYLDLLHETGQKKNNNNKMSAAEFELIYEIHSLN